MSRLRVAVLGYGYWGPNLVRNFYKAASCEVAAIADRDPQRLTAASHTYPAAEAVDDVDSLLTRSDIDAVAVATPPPTHYLLTKKALENGKHVLVEKPLTQTRREAEEVVALAHKSGRTLMVDHTFLYSGAVRCIRDLIDKGELGDLWYVDAVRINLGMFQQDVGVIEDLAPHDFSILDYLTGSQPKTVSAVGISPLSDGNNDPASLAYLTLRYEDGLLAQLHLSWLSPVKIRRMLVGGSKKMVVYDHLESDHQIKVYDQDLTSMSEGERRRLLSERRSGDLYAPKVDQTEPLERVCQHFVECALTSQQPLTDGVSGLRVVRLLEAALQSLRLGGETVSL